jgi:hypothetical protein
MRAAELVSGGAPLVLSMAGEALKKPPVSPVQTKDFVNLQLTADSTLTIWAYNLTESKDACTISLIS